ncbi:MAG: Gfo/Idh/MocA family oxidoreductase [Spirochaetia bacterium]|nr:Gfo/Idh/MocA family oxidoreductase [Spirochaetia bacterium]
MIRIGCVNIDTSHPLGFSDVLSASGRGAYTAVFNDGFRGDDEVAAFMKKNGIARRSQSLAAMAGEIDIAFIHAVNWDKHVEHAAPFVEKGIPVFIDKPAAGNLKDCLRLEAWEREGRTILGSSSLRYCAEVEAFKALPETERGEILHVFGTCGVDEFNYGIHVVEAIGGILGPGARSVRFLNAVSRGGKTIATYQAVWENGTPACYTTYEGSWQPNTLTIQTTTGTFNYKVDTAKLYAALLERVLDACEKKRPMSPAADFTESVKIMLAGKMSREKSGQEIGTASLSTDGPGFDGFVFEKAYAAQAKKMYV